MAADSPLDGGLIFLFIIHVLGVVFKFFCRCDHNGADISDARVSQRFRRFQQSGAGGNDIVAEKN